MDMSKIIIQNIFRFLDQMLQDETTHLRTLTFDLLYDGRPQVHTFND